MPKFLFILLHDGGFGDKANYVKSQKLQNDTLSSYYNVKCRTTPPRLTLAHHT